MCEELFLCGLRVARIDVTEVSDVHDVRLDVQGEAIEGKSIERMRRSSVVLVVLRFHCSPFAMAQVTHR